MGAPYEVSLTEGAQSDLFSFSKYAQRIILDGIAIHLTHEPTRGSRRLIKMRPNPVAAWELRLGDYRVLYDIDEIACRAIVQVIGEKRGNRLIVQGEEFTEHEND